MGYFESGSKTLHPCCLSKVVAIIEMRIMPIVRNRSIKKSLLLLPLILVVVCFVYIKLSNNKRAIAHTTWEAKQEITRRVSNPLLSIHRKDDNNNNTQTRQEQNVDKTRTKAIVRIEESHLSRRSRNEINNVSIYIEH